MKEQPDAPAPGTAGGSPDASPFTRFSDRDVVDLIAEFPLAWVCAAGAGPSPASLLPLLAETDADGRPTGLVGHMARHNRLYPAFQADPRCLVLFTGPQAYVSPELVTNRRWAPTWNYAQLRIAGELRFAVDGDIALSMVVEAMEDGRARPWRIEEMGDRYDMLKKAIVGFRISIATLDGRFKLGQDEPATTLRQIIAGHPDPALVRWMKRFNAARLEPATGPG